MSKVSTGKEGSINREVPTVDKKTAPNKGKRNAVLSYDSARELYIFEAIRDGTVIKRVELVYPRLPIEWAYWLAGDSFTELQFVRDIVPQPSDKPNDNGLEAGGNIDVSTGVK